jgi:hypothetical protein
MSQAEAQEQSERALLDRFLAATDQIATWTVERSAPSPFPDFVLRSQDRVAGVEVTEVYREHTGEGPRRQEIEGLRDRITLAAQRIWDSSGGCPVEVWVHFNSSFRLRKAHIQPLGSALATLVANHLPRLDKLVRLKNDGGPPREAFPDAFISLTIVRLSSHTRSHWHGSDADRGACAQPRAPPVTDQQEESPLQSIHLRGCSPPSCFGSSAGETRRRPSAPRWEG